MENSKYLSLPWYEKMIISSHDNNPYDCWIQTLKAEFLVLQIDRSWVFWQRSILYENIGHLKLTQGTRMISKANLARLTFQSRTECKTISAYELLKARQSIRHSICQS